MGLYNPILGDIPIPNKNQNTEVFNGSINSIQTQLNTVNSLGVLDTISQTSGFSDNIITNLVGLNPYYFNPSITLGTGRVYSLRMKFAQISGGAQTFWLYDATGLVTEMLVTVVVNGITAQEFYLINLPQNYSKYDYLTLFDNYISEGGKTIIEIQFTLYCKDQLGTNSTLRAYLEVVQIR